MAYWHEREAKERKDRRQPRSAAQDYATLGDQRSAGANGDTEGRQTGGNGEWEDEKEEVHLVPNVAFARPPRRIIIFVSKVCSLWSYRRRIRLNKPQAAFVVPP